MSKEFILDYIRDTYSMEDLIEKLEPYISMDDLLDALEPLINEHFFQAFEEELEDYYGIDGEV